MGIEEIAGSLSEIEKSTLKAIEDGNLYKVEEIASKAGVNLDSVRRAVEWLREKGLVGVEEKAEMKRLLTEKGKLASKQRFPETRLVFALKEAGGKAVMQEVQKRSGLGKEINFAMGVAKRNAWISVHKDEKGVRLELTGLERDAVEGIYDGILAKIELNELRTEEDEKRFSELVKTGFAERKSFVTRLVKINDDGEKALEIASGVRQRSFVVSGKAAEVPEIFLGKKQPYVQFLGQIRSKLVGLGFREMPAPLITQEFYNFDALFQPQGHPARSWSDTYQLKQPKFGKLPDAKIVAKVKAAHENGGNTGSRGWGYKWNEEIAKRLMPSAHGTAHSARQLVKGIEIPGKYFAIARCYRPDVVDATHLIEFNQLEGFIVDASFNFRHLLGMLKQFAIEIAGAEEVKFTTGYFPFTEPSCELYIKHKKIGWIEVGGAGIFRPELTLPLGIKEPVIAWGLGIDRLAMINLEINDIRQLFSNNLEWLRNMPIII